MKEGKKNSDSHRTARQQHSQQRLHHQKPQPRQPCKDTPSRSPPPCHLAWAAVLLCPKQQVQGNTVRMQGAAPASTCQCCLGHAVCGCSWPWQLHLRPSNVVEGSVTAGALFLQPLPSHARCTALHCAASIVLPTRLLAKCQRVLPLAKPQRLPAAFD